MGVSGKVIQSKSFAANAKFYLRKIGRTCCGPWTLCGRLEDMDQVDLRKGIDLDPYARVFSIFVLYQEILYSDNVDCLDIVDCLVSWAGILHIAWNRNSGTVGEMKLTVLFCLYTVKLVFNCVCIHVCTLLHVCSA